eukprot:5126063-Karenia_brevis.AAC.1
MRQLLSSPEACQSVNPCCLKFRIALASLMWTSKIDLEFALVQRTWRIQAAETLATLMVVLERRHWGGALKPQDQQKVAIGEDPATIPLGTT